MFQIISHIAYRVIIVLVIVSMTFSSRILLVNFNRNNLEPRRLIIDKTVLIDNTLELHKYITSAFPDIVDFSIEIYDKLKGRFIPLEGGAACMGSVVFPWQKGIVSILVVESITSSPNDALQIKGRAFDLPDNNLKIGDNYIHIGEIEAASLGTGLKTWDSSIVLAKYFEKNDIVAGNRVIEVGAGTGVPAYYEKIWYQTHN